MRVEQVFITPVIRPNGYGDEVDVSNFITFDGVSKIKRSIDSTDYSVGVFKFNSLRLKGENGKGLFNENDSRSIFQAGRNLSKVRVVVSDINTSTQTITNIVQFRGLVNEDGTRINISNNDVTLVALSNDSILRTTQVQIDSILDGFDVKTALLSILNQKTITDVLNIQESNINPDYNFIIGDGVSFWEKSVSESVNTLLLSSNSSLIIDESNNVIISSRSSNLKPPLVLKGLGSQQGDSNINSISLYNSGRQRQFNSVLLNNSLIAQDDSHVSEYGLKQKKFEFNYITNMLTLQEIGDRFVNEFKFPKIELKMIVPSPVVSGSALLDPVRVDAPWLRKRAKDKFFPVTQVATIGDDLTPLPLVSGSVQIDKNVKFKIISIEENTKLFTTVLKLRQDGTSSNDGQF